MKMNKKTILYAILITGMLMMACGMALPFFAGLQFVAFRYIFCTGAVLTLLSRLFSRYDGENLRIKRLHRLEFWSALLYCVAGFFLFYPHGTLQEALAFTLAGAVVQIYASIMTGVEEKKAKAPDKNK